MEKKTPTTTYTFAACKPSSMGVEVDMGTNGGNGVDPLTLPTGKEKAT